MLIQLYFLDLVLSLISYMSLGNPLEHFGVQFIHIYMLNQSILKEINPEYSLEGLMLKLKLWYFGHLMRRADLLGKALMLGKIEGRSRRGWQTTRYLDSITNSVDMNLSKPWEILEDGEAVVHVAAESWTWLSCWTITTNSAQLILSLVEIIHLSWSKAS